MKRLENETTCFNYIPGEAMHSSIVKLQDLIKNNPAVLEPAGNMNDNIKNIFLSEGFQLYPTVKRTTLFFDPATNCFFKILHPLKLKNKLSFLFTHKSRKIYNLSELLCAQGIKIQQITAYGLLKKGKLPLYVMKKAEGKSLYDILIREGKRLPMNVYQEAVNETAKLHSAGYWFGDAHLSHIFIKGSAVSGIIDIDSIKKNRPYLVKNIAKDIAGLNHPELPLTDDEKKLLIKHYLDTVNLKNKKKFYQMIKHYTERRWKD
jgi:hypothetical protein